MTTHDDDADDNNVVTRISVSNSHIPSFTHSHTHTNQTPGVGPRDPSLAQHGGAFDDFLRMYVVRRATTARIDVDDVAEMLIHVMAEQTTTKHRALYQSHATRQYAHDDRTVRQFIDF